MCDFSILIGVTQHNKLPTTMITTTTTNGNTKWQLLLSFFFPHNKYLLATKWNYTDCYDIMSLVQYLCCFSWSRSVHPLFSNYLNKCLKYQWLVFYFDYFYCLSHVLLFKFIWNKGGYKKNASLVFLMIFWVAWTIGWLFECLDVFHYLCIRINCN